MYSNDMTAHRKSSASGPPKQADNQAAVLQIVTPMIAAAAPPLVGMVGLEIVSTTEGWDYSRCVIEFLEGLKNREADREGNAFSLLLFPPSNSSY
jgi:hypothetical protein